MAVQRFGLFGWPVKHSVSPQMQGAGFKAVEVDASYELIEVAPEYFEDKVDELIEADFSGWNITIPHKSAMVPLLDEISDVAKHADSVNTVVNNEGFLSGYSTDGYGLEMSIKEAFDIPVKNKSFLFWGCGGAARATALHFALEGAAEITLVNRTLSRAEELGDRLLAVCPDLTVHIFAADNPALIEENFSADVMIQSSSVGLKESDPIAIPELLLKADRCILDMIYHPTLLQRRARELKCNVADGKGMLLYQGVKSFSLWTGIENPPVEAMRSGLEDALKH